MDIDKLLYDIGFTTTHLSISNESLKLLDELKTEKSSYISSIPNEIYQIIIKYLYYYSLHEVNTDDDENDNVFTYSHNFYPYKYNNKQKFVLIDKCYLGLMIECDKFIELQPKFINLYKYFNTENIKMMKICEYNFVKNRNFILTYLNEITPSTELGKMMNKKIKYILNEENKK